jgi:(+)-pinoresinol hydroxylase
MSRQRANHSVGRSALLRALAGRRQARRILLASLGAGLLAAPAIAADPSSYISWSQTAVTAKATDPKGLAQYESSCMVCHGSGPARPGTRALTTKYHGPLPALLQDRTDLAPDYIRTVVRHGLTVMPPFRKTELSDADLDAIVAYLTRKRR